MVERVDWYYFSPCLFTDRTGECLQALRYTGRGGRFYSGVPLVITDQLRDGSGTE